MSVFKRPDSDNWWFKFVWQGKEIRESTKQTNKRVAEQIEAARRTALAKGEVGIRDRKAVPTMKDFIERDFRPFVESRFHSKLKTLEYYRNGLKNLTGYTPLAECELDAITSEKITGFVSKRQDAGLKVSTINRQLEVLRRVLKLATKWGKVERAPPSVEMLPGENHRELVLSTDEETRYLNAAATMGTEIEEAYQSALEGIRATKRGQRPIQPTDAFLLRDVSTILIDCGVRPEECFRLRWEYVRDGAVHVPFGKTESARRTIPLTQRAIGQIEMRRQASAGPWIFPAPTKSGHIEKSSLKKQHAKACKAAKIPQFPLYTFRHTCITRWAAFMDPYTLGYLAGHSDFATTKRYVHPQAHTVNEAIERARSAQGGYDFRYRTKETEGIEQSTEAAIN